MNKERLDFLKLTINQNYTERHDIPQIHFNQSDLRWLIEQAESVQEMKNEKQTALEALKIVDEITEKMLMDCDHASALGAYFNPSAEDLASDIGSVVLEALEKMNEDVTEGQERVIERKYNKMFEALKWIEECSVDYQSINKAKIALGVKS